LVARGNHPAPRQAPSSSHIASSDFSLLVRYRNEVKLARTSRGRSISQRKEKKKKKKKEKKEKKREKGKKKKKKNFKSFFLLFAAFSSRFPFFFSSPPILSLPQVLLSLPISSFLLSDQVSPFLVCSFPYNRPSLLPTTLLESFVFPCSPGPS
jgi:hypothetical protein